jgi:exodeoxyribonuclease VII large subunit
VLSSPTAYLDLKRMELDHITARLTGAEERWLSSHRQRFAGMAAALDAMSPLKVLARGYTMASKPDGKLVRSVHDANPGDALQLRLSDGTLPCIVQEGET